MCALPQRDSISRRQKPVGAGRLRAARDHKKIDERSFLVGRWLATLVAVGVAPPLRPPLRRRPPRRVRRQPPLPGGGPEPAAGEAAEFCREGDPAVLAENCYACTARRFPGRPPPRLRFSAAEGRGWGDNGSAPLHDDTGEELLLRRSDTTLHPNAAGSKLGTAHPRQTTSSGEVDQSGAAWPGASAAAAKLPRSGNRSCKRPPASGGACSRVPTRLPAV